MTATQRLIDFARTLGWNDIPTAPRTAAKRHLFDTLVVAVAGSRTPAAEAARRFAQSHFAPGPCTVIGSGDRLCAPAATFANGIAASVLDLDDGHRQAMGHPAASVIPAALAVAEQVDASGADLLAAIVAGYEVAVRCSVARLPQWKDQQYASGIWGGLGAAVAAGKLLGFDAEQFQSLLGVAVGHAPFPPSGMLSNAGMVKEGIGWSGLNGCSAAFLVQSGFHGAPDALDRCGRFDLDGLVEGLGEDFAIERGYLKPHAACRWAHAAIDAALALRRERAIDAGQVETIGVAGFHEITRLDERRPRSAIAAQFSLPFCVATALRFGEVMPEHLSAEHLDDEETLALAQRVELSIDPAFNAEFPAKTMTRLTLITTTGIYTKTIEYPKGNSENPLSDAELQQKAHRLLDPIVGDEAVTALWHSVAGADTLASGSALLPVRR